MSYVNNNLMAGEGITYQAKIHWAIFFPSIACLVVATLLHVTATVDSEKGAKVIANILIIFSIWLALKAFIYKISTELAITNKRIIAKTGLIKRNTIELNHSKVESFAVNQSILGRILGFGTITISGTGGVKNPILGIDSPLEFRNKAVLAIDIAQAGSN